MEEQIKKFFEPKGSDDLRDLGIQMQRIKIILEYLKDYHPVVFEQAIRRANTNKEILR
tara:strand:+ start:1187 stop:1360 length:174 start_codon:yes stop_codon:yes gene_type:complete